MDREPRHNKKEARVILDTFSLLSSKWVLPILKELSEGTKRYGELKKALTGISPNTLSIRLRDLEKAGIIGKKIHPEVPPRVEYSFTLLGESLHHVLVPLFKWTLDHYAKGELKIHN